nr:hypothetical protein [Tanacetum cinerariifolium]
MSDMTTLLTDLSYIPLNNEHNDPNQRDIGETSNEPTQAIRNEFEELYASANEELYPGCDYVTRLDFMAKFTYFKVKGRLTDSIFNEMLEYFQNVFHISKGYKLPPSYYVTKKTFKMIGLGYESIHACEHDCCLFRGKENKDLDFCPVCNTSRWQDSNTQGKKVPKKVLRYFPIIPRLQRLYKSSHTTKKMIWHATEKCTGPSKMQHPIDGRAWKKFDTIQAYSMWPAILTTYNLPMWLCMKESSFMKTLLIPGPNSPGKDIYVYLRPLIKDLKVLWDRKGVETIDVASGQKFNMRAMVLWTINDFSTRSSLSGHRQGKTRLAKVGHSKRLMAQPNQNREVLEASGCVFFHTREPKKFCQFIKGVKLPDGFGSCFKYKVTDKDTNISGLKSHDCHIMMQRLHPYGLHQYLPDKIAKPIIELCSLFKQICSATLMKDDMLKAQIKVVDILCDLKLIYDPALFDIMIHLVIYLPLEDLEGGPIHPQWMFPFERYIKKLKGYVFQSVCKSIGLRLFIRFDAQELKKVKWYVLHNSPEIDTYRFQFKSGICSPGPDEEMYYGQLQKILEFKYLLFKVVLFRVKWFDTRNQGRKVKCLILRNNMTQIDCRGEAFKNDKYILITKVKQVFYLEDKAKPHWKVVEHVNHEKFSNGGVIMVEDDPDIIYFNKSSDLLLSASLNDLDNATLHIDGQSTKVDASPDIIDVPDEDDDIIDDKDALPYDLADFDNEDLINVDDDGVDKVYSSEEED